MAITVTLALTNPATARAGQRLNGICAITNNGANTVEVLSVNLAEASVMGAKVGGPYFLTPNVAPGTGEPTIESAATSYFPFSIVIPSPNTPGSSPSSVHVIDGVYPAANSWARFQCNVMTYDSVAEVNVVGEATLAFAVASSVAPFPMPQGGALQFDTGGDAVNWFFF